MREILFRGKRKDNEEWEYGFLIGRYDPMIKENTIKFAYIDNGTCFYDAVEVIPKTVGQYTGLTDKNGKKIFEGDIVEGLDFTTEDGGYGVVSFDEGAFEVVGSCDNNIVGTFHENYYGKNFEVIGNIHDNPELLKGE